MPFAITCPACHHNFRTAKEREIGKGVQCAKCGHQFYISADNQVEVRESKGGPPPVPKKSSSTRSREREAEEDDNDEARPSIPTRRKKPGKILLILGLVGFVLLAASGTGVYLVFFQDSGKSAEDKVRPQRDLQMDMFAYVPASPKHVRYVDVERGRESKDEEAQLAIDGVFPNALRLPTDLLYVCATSDSDKKVPANYLLSYGSPVDLAALVAGLKLQPLTGKLSRVYVGRFETNEYAIFQPTPTKLFVACSFASNKSTKPSEQLLEELLGRDPSASRLPTEWADGITAVSGYPVIKVLNQAGGERPHTQYTGSVTTASIKERHLIAEHYTVRQFGSEADAKESMKLLKAKSEPKQKSKKETLDDYRWLRGDKLHFFGRTKTAF